MTIAEQIEAKGFEKGEAIGIEKGIEKGKAMGSEYTQKTIAEKLLQQGFSLERISEITGLPLNKLHALFAVAAEH